jgi:hypothetical protein
MQDYGRPASRNTMRAASALDRPAGMPGAMPKGGNATQGAGELPAKVSVPLPGTNETQSPYKGGMKSQPPGFGGGLIPGKI